MLIEFIASVFAPTLYIIYGLLIGSFLSVCIYRIPLGRTKGLASLDENEEEEDLKNLESEIVSSGGEKVSFFYPKRSLCPSCRNFLKWWMNIPLFSWIFLGGKCFFCKTKISCRYPIIELMSAFFCFLSFSMFPFSTALIIYIFVCAMIVISFIDVEYYIIPNVITFPGMLIALILAFINQFKSIFVLPLAANLTEAFLGFLLGGGFLWMVSALYRVSRGKEGLGFGDVKLMALAGLLFGPQAALFSIFIGSLLGSMIGVLILILKKENFSRPLPFGPFLAVGTLTYIFINSKFPIISSFFLIDF